MQCFKMAAVVLALALSSCAGDGDGTLVSGPYSNGNSANSEPFSAASLPAGANSHSHTDPYSQNYGTLGTVGR